MAVLALPFLLGAITRAKVTKSNGDVRAYEEALELFFLDWKVYPRDHFSAWPYWHPQKYGFTTLTTPTQYLMDLPIDPFGNSHLPPDTLGISGKLSLYYSGGSGSDSEACGGLAHYSDRSRLLRNPSCIHAYLVTGHGPDGWKHTHVPSAFPAGDDFAYPVSMITYSPTNGLRSFGDIFTMVGDWKRGYVQVDFADIATGP